MDVSGIIRPMWRGGGRRRFALHASSSEEDPPKTNSVEKGYDLNYKIYASVIVLRSKAGYFYY